MKTDHLTPHQLELIENELLDEETLLWVGQPDALTIAIQREGGPAVMVLIPALIAMMSAAGSLAPLAAIVFLIAFIAFLNSLVRYRQAKKILYAITDQRVLVLERNKVTSYGKKDVGTVERYGNQVGNLIFREDSRYLPTGYGGTSQSRKRGLIAVRNVRQVEAILLRVLVNDVPLEKAKREDTTAAEQRLSEPEVQAIEETPKYYTQEKG